jgi:iron complex transport system permease protein
VTTLLLYRIATRQGRTSVATMLLAGLALDGAGDGASPASWSSWPTTANCAT